MRDSASPTSFRPAFSPSLSNSLTPSKLTWAIAGRSSTTTTMTLPSASMRTSRKKPVAYSALIDALAPASVRRSPTRTGR